MFVNVKRLQNKKITIELTKKALDYIVENAYDERYGARPIKRYVSRNIETLIAENIIEDKIKSGSHIIIDENNNKFIIKRV